MRTSKEIQSVFEARGCRVVLEFLGHSYRAGGQIFVFAPGVKEEDGVSFVKADFAAFDGTGYDGRGRHWAVYLVSKGDYVPCTEAEFNNADKDKRISFGTEHRSCSNLSYFIHREEKEKKGLSDFNSAFAALGL